MCVTLLRASGNFLSKSIPILCISKNALKPCWSEVRVQIKNERWSFTLLSVSLFEIPRAEEVLVLILRVAGRAECLGVLVVAAVAGGRYGAVFSPHLISSADVAASLALGALLV